MHMLDAKPSGIRLIPGISPPNEIIKFTFQDQKLSAFAGECLASALMRAGHITLGHTRTGLGRGYFCGMGLCWECALHVQGHGIVRACCHPVTPGQVVSCADDPHPPP